MSIENSCKNIFKNFLINFLTFKELKILFDSNS